MRSIRIIPRLDIKGPNLVKGVHMEGLRVLGSPEHFAYQHYLDGADELIYIDIVASLYGRNNLLDIVKRTAEKIFIPLTVGGGIRSVEDIRNILRAGADKVAINTAAVQNPKLICEGVKAFGSQCIVISIETRRKSDGRYEIFTDNARQETGIDALDWARKAHELGAGEILITSIDRDGTGEGYDIELVSRIAEAVSIPVIACGGAGKFDHVVELIDKTGVSAVAAASIFHYNRIAKDAANREFEEGNVEFLKQFSRQDGYQFKRIQPISISGLKSHIRKDKLIHMRSCDVEGLKAPADTATGEAPAVAMGKRPFVVVADYGCGNLFSISHALKEIGARFEISSDPAILKKADRIILPGVGAFADGMKNLGDRGLVELLKRHSKEARPILGICLGMQLLMEEGAEFGAHEGLGLIRGVVKRLEIDEGSEYSRVPHIGWNRIMLPFAAAGRISWDGTIFENVKPESLMYFIHSYVAVPQYREDVLAETEYGGATFCSAVRHGNSFGCQFHPERSGKLGLDIYRQFVFGRHADISAVFDKNIATEGERRWNTR